jgi:AcrR family transcriptional regulator
VAVRDPGPILDAALRLLAGRAPEFSMSALAREAGVGRATLYRAFPDRASVIAAATALALAEAGTGLREAKVDALPLGEAVRTAARVLIEVASRFYLAYNDGAVDPAEQDRQVGSVVRSIVTRGRSDGLLRDDCPVGFQVDSFSLLARVGCEQHVFHGATVDDAAGWVAEAFLEGAARR